jgi:hypothetical protein
MIGLIVILLFDTSFIKVYDLLYKGFTSMPMKITLFAFVSFACLFTQYLIISYIRNSFQRFKLGQPELDAKRFYRISSITLVVLAASFVTLTLQMFYQNYYSSFITTFIISLSYGMACVFLIIFCSLFWSWYKSNRELVVLLYFLSIAFIILNFIVTATYTSYAINDRPSSVRQYVGGSIDVSVGRHTILHSFHSISSILAFVSLWITTVALMRNYTRKLINAIAYWALLSLPLIYFLIDYFYQFILINLLSGYLTIDPITVSFVLTAFLSFSKPVGGLTFAVVFWKMSRTLSYERKVQTYMIISGWGILLVFSADQGLSQSLSPFPPFGLVTNVALILGSYLMLLGIYHSARLVAANIDLRKSIYKHAAELKLLGVIGRAEMDKELQNSVGKILQEGHILEQEQDTNLNLDVDELKKHLDFVSRELNLKEKKEEE